MIMFQSFLLSLLVAGTTALAPASQYGHHQAPELLCRDTNTSIYAEVCVPAFAEQVTPVTLVVKEVVDNDYCFDRVLTICEETNTMVQREICTYVYEREDVTAPCTTTQVTYEEKSETMKVTACGVQAPAYGYGHPAPAYGHQASPQGEHQLCREEYQTQAYKVPLVTAPLVLSCNLAYPAAREVCVVKDITITEVKCEDLIENKCFNVAKFVDATNTVDQKEIIIGEPSCEQITLTLDTQACRQQHHSVVAHAVPVHHAVHHAAPNVYHG
jgi:hypothetical protein